MKKLKTYYRYLEEYLKYQDIESILDSVLYLLFGVGSRRNRITNSGFGKIHLRKGTNDFQYANYNYEWPVKRFVYEHMGEYSYFLDIGAGIGEYTILNSMNNKKVFAFEPQEDSYQSILINLNINRVNDTEVFNFGLGKKSQTIPFAINPVNTGASYVLENKEKLPKGHILGEIKIEALDALIDDLNVDFSQSFLIKLDVEGMEPDILEGAKTFIQKCKHALIILEDKHAGEDNLRAILNSISDFKYGRIDEYNIKKKK